MQSIKKSRYFFQLSTFPQNKVFFTILKPQITASLVFFTLLYKNNENFKFCKILEGSLAMLYFLLYPLNKPNVNFSKIFVLIKKKVAG